MSNNVMELLQGIIGELKVIAKSETIIGEPVTAGDRTVIPVSRISVGFGAGGFGEAVARLMPYGRLLLTLAVIFVCAASNAAVSVIRNGIPPSIRIIVLRNPW